LDDACSLCENSVKNSGLCSVHYSAYKNLNDGHEKWLQAYSKALDMKEYLKNIIELEDSGKAVKEVASHLLKNELKI
jgi:hypothetical protein